MAFTCGFFNSQNGDRKYNAEQMASIFDGLIKDGVYDTVGDIFAVTPGTGMQVLVGSGRAWFDHTWNNNDAQYPLAITAADVSLPRYDAVVLETNHSDTVRTNRLRVLTGTPARNPVKPTMTSTANVKQHPLAYIRVTAGATAIKQSMIQVVVGTSECPFVTGIIDTAQIDALFQQWNGEFNEWFDNLKAQLSDNVVANLQGQIDQKVAKADVATTADIEAGTSTTKWVTPKGLSEAGINGGNIGDIKNTIRNDLDDHWALCNGEEVDGNKYPELVKHIPMKSNLSNVLKAYFSYRDVFYYDGLWVTIGSVAGRQNKQFICTATNPSDTWTTTIINTNAAFQSIYCYNGTWVIGTSTGQIYYTSDPTGNWTEKKISDYSIRQVYCYNGTWVALASYINGYLYYTNNITGQWALKTFEKGMSCISCYNGLWVVAGSLSTIYYSTSISGNWTSKTIGDSMSYETICCYGGQWRIGGYCTYTNGTPYVYSISGDISGDWTGYNMPSQSHVYKIFCSGGKWFHIIYTSSNRQYTLADATNLGSTNGLVSYSNQSLLSICGHDDKFITIGQYTDSNVYSGAINYSNGNLRSWGLVGNNNGLNTYLAQNANCRRIYYNAGKWINLSQEESYGRVYVSTTDDPYAPWYGANPIRELVPNDICFYNGLWVLVGFSKNTSVATIYTTTNLNGTWTLAYKATNTVSSPNRIFCYNGTWVACGNNGYVYIADNPNSTWTVKNIGSGTLTAIYCYNGTWVTCSSNGNIYVTDNPNGTWTRMVSSSYNFASLYCHNGTWVAVGSTNTNPRIYVTTNPKGSWTEQSMPNIFTMTGVYYACGKWILASGNYIYTTTNPYSSWLGNNINDSISSSIGNVNSIASDDSYNVFIGTSSYSSNNLINVLPTVSIDGCYSYIKIK